MTALKPVLILAILASSLLCNKAWATDPPPRPGATRPLAEPTVPTGKTDQAAPAPPVAGTAKTKPAAKPKRRAVRQIVDGMPARAAAADLAPPGPPAVPQPTLPQPLPSPQTQDGSYKGGVGNALISPQGKLCSNNGITVQCF